MSVGARGILLVLFLFVCAGGVNRAQAMVSGVPVHQIQPGPEQAIVGLQLLDQFDKIISSCAGVILRADAILTAGHCIDIELITNLVSVRVLRATDLRTLQPQSMVRDVRRYYRHDRYNSQQFLQGKKQVRTYDHDLAVLFLHKPLEGSIPSIRLLQPSETLSAGTPLMLYGYGMSNEWGKGKDVDQGGEHYRRLQRGVFVLDSKTSFGRLMTVKDSQISLCYGDSGAPGFLVDKNFNPLPIVATINSGTNETMELRKGSWKSSCRGEAILQPIAPYASWIQHVLNREAPRS